MRVGFIGLGKLGLPVAMATASRGHEVIGTDASAGIKDFLDARAVPYQEAGLPELFEAGVTVGWRATIGDVMHEADIIFTAVQTPHAPEYEGVTPMPEESRDFEYGYLETAVKECVRTADHPVTLVIVSTVLPGTTHRVILPHVRRNPHIHLVYSPAFIAMGTTVHDWLHPEFVLCGSDDGYAIAMLTDCHAKMHQSQVRRMSIESAELAKVTYNTAISFKIVVANTIMEIAHKIGADCDDVAGVLAAATDRVASGKYFLGGMGDAGGCHPRDAIAMSHLAERLDLSVDPFRWLMHAREAQARWIGKLAYGWSSLTRLPVRICGREYKKESNLTVGSCSRLLAGMIDAEWQDYEPIEAAVYVIGVNHDQYREWRWPSGSVVLDPWGYVPDYPGAVVVRVGRRS